MYNYKKPVPLGYTDAVAKVKEELKKVVDAAARQ